MGVGVPTCFRPLLQAPGGQPNAACISPASWSKGLTPRSGRRKNDSLKGEEDMERSFSPILRKTFEDIDLRGFISLSNLFLLLICVSAIVFFSRLVM